VNTNVPKSIPPEHLQRATELIEQGMEKEDIFETLKSEELAGNEISDACCFACHTHLRNQEQTLETII
jgi:hypothetical protein